MALRCLLHSACQVIGSPNDTNMQYKPIVGHTNEELRQGDHVNSLKVPNGGASGFQACKENYPSGFQMPLHYPRYKKTDYEKMEEWRVDLLLKQYGLSFEGTLDEKRAYAMGAFLWPGQY